MVPDERFGRAASGSIPAARRQRAAASEGAARAGVALRELVFGLMLAGLVAALFVFWKRSEIVRGPTPHAPELESRAELHGLRGEVELAGGARLVATLARLQATSARQQFDAIALRRALELADGEPYACELFLVAPAAAAPDNGDTSASHAFDYEQLTIVDASGVALQPIVPGDASSSNADPLRTLMSPPSGGLHAGQSVRVVLWGRAPMDDARLHLPPLADVPLVAASIARHGPDHALARIDTAADRAPAASEGAR